MTAVVVRVEKRRLRQIVPCAILGSTNSFKLLQITRLGPRADCCTAGEGVTNEQLCTC